MSKVMLDLENDVTLDEILHVFEFDFERGKVFWKNPVALAIRNKGHEAGTPCHNKKNSTKILKQYWWIGYKHKRVYRGKLIYFAYHGQPPKKWIDHINGNSLDDRISNLRESDAAQNCWNTVNRKLKNKALPQGVFKPKTCKRYIAKICFRGTIHHLGLYDTPDLASTAYQTARKQMYGEFA